MSDYRTNVEKWLSGDYDAETKEEIKRLLSEDEAALEDAFYKNLEFGTGGLRGVMGVGTNRMNKYTVGMATQGLANYILSHSGDYLRRSTDGRLKVCISYDSRNHSAEFARITADVMSANGIDVFLFDGIRPTPEMSYAVRLKKAIAGIMITASHNPKEYNGYKVSWSDGGQVTSPVDKEIVAEVSRIEDPSQVRFSGGDGRIEMMGSEVDEQYLSDLGSLALSPEACARHSDIRIVYTPLHGCGVKLVPEILHRSGFDNIIHVPEQDMSDGNFPTVISPNPEEPAALRLAIAKAIQTGADIVIGTDPDADRMGIAVRDYDGNMVLFNGNQTASMLTYYILSRWKELGKLDSGNKYVVKTIVTTELISAIAESFSVPVYNVLTGFKYIAEVVKRKEAEGWEFICGGEESYGFNVGEFVRDKDAPVSCMMLAECAAWAMDQGLTLYGLMQKIYKEYGYRKEGLVSVVRKGVSGAAEIRKMMDDLRSDPPAQMCGSPVTKVIDYLEPEKTHQPSSNVLQFFNADGDVVSIRPSGTEPKIKFYFGAKGADADSKIEELKRTFCQN